MSNTVVGQVGLGTTLSIGSIAGTTGETFTPVGSVSKFTPSGQDAQVIKFSTLDKMFVQKLAGVRDGGTVEVEIVRNATDAGQVALAAANADPTGSPYDFKLVLAKTASQTTAGDTYAFSAIVSKYRPISSADPDKLLSVMATLDLTTAMVLTAGS